eukprot:g4400.t1
MLPELRCEFEHMRAYALCDKSLEKRRENLEELRDVQRAMLGCGPLLLRHFSETVQICEADLRRVEHEINEKRRRARYANPVVAGAQPEAPPQVQVQQQAQATKDPFLRIVAKWEKEGEKAADRIAGMIESLKDNPAKLSQFGQTVASVDKALAQYERFKARKKQQRLKEQATKAPAPVAAPKNDKAPNPKKPAAVRRKRPASQDPGASAPPQKKTKEEIEENRKQKERRKRLEAKKEAIAAKHEEPDSDDELYDLLLESQRPNGGPAAAAGGGEDGSAGAATSTKSKMTGSNKLPAVASADDGTAIAAAPPKRKRMTKQERAEAKRLRQEEQERQEREFEAKMTAMRKKFEAMSEEEKEKHFEKLKRERIENICREMDEQMTSLLRKKADTVDEGGADEKKDDAAAMEVDTDHNASATADDDAEKDDDVANRGGNELERDEEKSKPSIDPEQRRKYYMKLVHQREEEVTGKTMPKLKIPLMEHQVEALQWLLSIYNNTTGGLLADEMGLGKTATVISFLAYLREQRNNRGPHLIVVPKTVLQNWQDEIDRFYPAMKKDLVVYSGNVEERDELDDVILERLETMEREKKKAAERAEGAAAGGKRLPSARKSEGGAVGGGTKSPRHAAAGGVSNPTDGRGTAKMEVDGGASAAAPNSPGRSPRAAGHVHHHHHHHHHHLHHGLIILTNYEMLSVHKNFTLLEPEYEVVVVDEAQRMKSAKTQFSLCMNHKVTAKKKVLLTGTPLQNKLGELWCLLNYILPDLFDSVGEFQEWFNAPFKEEMDALEQAVLFSEQEEAVLTKNLHAMLAPFMLKRMKAEVFGSEMPPCVQHTIRISLSHWQRKLYGQLQDRSLAVEQVKQRLELEAELGGMGEDQLHAGEAKEEKKQAQHEMANIMMQMRKCVLHPFLFSDMNKTAQLNLTRTSGKFEVLERVLRKLTCPRVDHKILLFSQFTSCLDLIGELLDGMKLQYLRIDGSVSAKERQNLINEFTKEPRLKVMLLSAKAASVGINLQCADTVIIFDMDWNPQNDRQAIGRAHRVGQKREVRVLRFITTSAVEEIMEQRCREKLDMEKKIIGAGGFNAGLEVKEQPISNHAAVVKMIQESKEAAQKCAVASKYDDGAHVSKFPPTTVPDTCANYDAELSKLVKELDALESAQRMAKVSSLTAENMEYLVGAKRLMAIDEVPDALKYEEESASSVSAEQDVGGTPSESTSSSSSSEPSEEDEKGA